MKTKILLFLLILLGIGGSASAQGTQNVKGSYGCGSPAASNVIGDVGSRYIDQCASPPVEWIITAINPNGLGNGVPTATWTQGGSGGGITSVSSLPATCTPGTTQPVSITGSLVIGGITYGAGTVFYCDSTNHFSPVAQGAGASPIMAFYISPACPPANSAQCFNTFADTQQVNDCAWTSGLPDVTCNTAHFVAADVGKRAFGYKTCMASVNLAANSNNGPITTGTALTIATFVSSTHITLSGNAANTVTTSGTFPIGGCFIWGHPDDAAAVAVDAAMQAAPFCSKLDQAAANYMYTTFHFVVNPPACAALGTSGGQNAGNIVYSSGFELEGRGAGTTNWYLPPGWPETGTCTNGLSGRGCWVIPLQGKWHDFQITGGGNRIAPNMAGGAQGSNIIEMDGPASLENFVAYNFSARGAANNLENGVGAYLWSQINHVNLSAFGTVQLATNVSSSVTAIQLWMENVGVGAINAGSLADYFTQSVAQFSKYNLICYDCSTTVESTVDASTPPFFIVNKGLAIKWIRGAVSMATLQSQNNAVGYDCTQAGCVFDADSMYFDMSAGGSTGTGYIAIDCPSVCTNYIRNSTIKGSAGGSALTDVAGSRTFDEGGNTWGAMTLSGAFIGEANSANQVIVTAAKTVLSAGWGNGPATVTALSGGDFPIQFTVTNTGAGQGASPTITYTFPTALQVAPYSCTATQVGGTNATGTFTTSALSATGATFTFSLTPTAAATEIVQVNCVTP